MKNKIHFWFVSFTMLVLITGCVQGKCGDGICQKREELKQNCPLDCSVNTTEAFCGNGVCESEEDEHNCPQDCQGQPAPGSIETIKQHGGRVSWSHAQDLIAFDRTDWDGYTDIYVMNPDGTDEECLTCNQDELPQLNIGNPEWHPSGDYIVFQVQNPALNPPSSMSKEIYRYVASPGAGINNDLWVMSSDGTQFWQLTEVEDLHGTLHPHFSLDGSQLIWSEMISPLSNRIGNWAIKLADFEIVNGEPRLTNIKTMRPEDLQLYETHTFSPDGRYIIFSGVPHGGYYYGMENYILDLETGQTTQLTNNDEWDEQAHFVSQGKQIVWVSSEGNPQPKSSSLEGIIENPPLLDYWIMNLDGSGKQRLTGFNNHESPDYFPIDGGIGLGDFDVSPDGNTIIGKMRQGRQDTIVRIELDLSEGSSTIPDDLVEMDYVLKDFEVIKENGGRVDWSHETDLIAFDQEGTDGFFDLYTMNPDGSGEKCLTFNKAGLPGRHMGQPAWHPSGEYIVFQAQEVDYVGDSILASPGWGIGNNLWAITADGEEYWMLTNVSPGSGVLHPHFSHDGKKLVWSEIAAGDNDASTHDIGDEFANIWNLAEFWATRDWVINIADFDIHDGVPQLSNFAPYKPGSEVIGLRETHGFSPDDEMIIFSSIHDHGNWWAPDIYSMELSTGFVQRLTSTADHWDEHAQYSPDGGKIIWITSEGFKDFSGDGRNELWIMNADGSDKRSVTYFNQPGQLGYTGYGVACGDSSWSTDGERLALYRILIGKNNPDSANYPNRTTEIVMLEFDL